MNKLLYILFLLGVGAQAVQAQTQLRTEDCGINDVPYNQPLRADAVSGVDQYEFLFDDGAGYSESVVRNGRTVRLNNLAITPNPGTTFNVTVRTITGGIPSPYGSVCQVTSISHPASEIEPLFQNQVALIDEWVEATQVIGADSYEFLVENTTLGYSSTIVRNNNRFRFNQLPVTIVPFNEYQVSVRTVIGQSTSPYGVVHSVTAVANNLTQLEVVSCNAVDVALDQALRAESVNSATSYVFHVTGPNGFDEELTKSGRTFRLRELNTLPRFATVYNVRIKTVVGGVTSPEGPSCAVTVVDHPGTQLESVHCPSADVALDDLLRADAVGQADSYTFRVQNTEIALDEEVIRGNRNFRFSNLSIVARPGLTYDISVKTNVDGQISQYGSVCQVTLEGHEATQLEVGSCDITDVAFDQTLRADAVAEASSYEFRVVNVATSYDQSVVRNGRTFTLNNLPVAPLFAHTYQVTVRTTVDGSLGSYGPSCDISTPGVIPLTELEPADCNATSVALDQNFSAIAVPGADQYEFLVTGPGVNESIVRNNRTLRLTQLTASAQNGATYTVTVRAIFAGVPGIYGNPCTISTELLPSTQLSTGYCNVVGASIDALLQADPVAGADSYDFEVNGPGVSEVLNRTSANFRLEQLVAPIAYNTLYQIRVRAVVGGVPGSYGTACDVTTKAHPFTQIEAADCTPTPIPLNQTIQAEEVPEATEYHFKVVNAGLGYDQEVIRTNRNFRLNMLTVTPPAGETYTVTVRTLVGGNLSGYGSACQVTTIGDNFTQLEQGDCDIIGVEFDQLLQADPVSGVDAYIFRVELAGVGGFVEQVSRPNRNFRLNQLVSNVAEHNRVYTITIATEIGGVVSSFGPACTIRTVTADGLSLSTGFVNKGATVQVTGSGQLRIAGNYISRDNAITNNDGAVSFTGDIVNEGNSLIVTGTGPMVANGEFDQNVRNNVTSIDHLEIDKSTGELNLQTATGINQELTLTQGRLVASTGNELSFVNGAIHSGAGEQSFVSGPVVKYGDEEFTFPIGAESTGYHPMSISAPQQTSDAVRGEYTGEGQVLSNNLDPSLEEISDCEYWLISADNGTPDLSVSLHWNENSCEANEPLELLVSDYDGTSGEWENAGKKSVNGNTASGFIKARKVFTASQNPTNLTLSHRIGFDEVYAYADVKKKLDGGFVTPDQSGLLHVRYVERYNDLDGLLNFEITDEDKLPVPLAQSFPISHGENRIDMDVNGFEPGYYVLKVTNEKNESWYLKFKI